MSTLRVSTLQNASSSTANITLDASGNATVGGTLAMGSSFLRNKIINGDMRIDQRNAGASVTQSNSVIYGVDRWASFGSSASKFTNQRSTTAPSGFSNSNLITSSSAYSVTSSQTFSFFQYIEGFNTVDLAFGTASAKSITISFWVRSSLTGTFGGWLANAALNRTCAFSFTISSADTWEYKTVTIAGDTTGTWARDNTTGLQLAFSMGCGSNFLGTPGTWTAGTSFGASGQVNLVGTNGATFYITGVQLEVGSVATPFERRQYGTELMLCQRYLPAYNSSTANHSPVCVAGNYSSTAGTATFSFMVAPRVQPTGISSTGTFRVHIPGVGTYTVTLTADTASPTAQSITLSGTAMGTGLGQLLSASLPAQILMTGCEL